MDSENTQLCRAVLFKGQYRTGVQLIRELRFVVLLLLLELRNMRYMLKIRMCYQGENG